MTQKIEERIKENRPKRLLSIDGGGIRGILGLQILKEIEDIILECNPSCKCLGDYFDFIAGTSTGAIIAAGLAAGMKVDDLLKLYRDHGQEIFQKIDLTDADVKGYFQPYLNRVIESLPWWGKRIAKWLKGWVEENIPKWIKNYLKSNNMDDSMLLQLIKGCRYNPDILKDKLTEHFKDYTLGSEELKTLLMIVTKNATTGQPCFFVNNPKDKDFHSKYSKIRLTDLVLASSAAPTYFPPHSFKVGDDEVEFIDGAMSTFNNPSFMLFLQAVTQQFGINWSSGEDKLLMISLGTGFSQHRLKWNEEKQDYMKAKDYKVTDWAGYAIGALMEDANVQANLIMRLIGTRKDPNSPYTQNYQGATYIDNWQFPDVTKENQKTKWFKYRRYTCLLDQEYFKELKEKLNVELSFEPDDRKKIERINKIDCTEMIEDLCKIGESIAKKQVEKAFFEGFTEKPINPQGSESVGTSH